MLVPAISDRRRARALRLGTWAVALAAASFAVATRAPTASSDDATSPVEDTVILGDRDTGRRLAWIVELGDPVIAEGTLPCVAAGPSCAWDGMLVVDTTALRAAALASSLANAIDPRSSGYLGNQTDDRRDLAVRTVESATGLAEALRRWSSSGCGSNIDGVEVIAARPSECPDWANAVQADAEELTELLAAWPTP